jgi:ArsR family transcriptional regulator, arsenate/arsenite/antimonite-responsive transcriptional repressor
MDINIAADLLKILSEPNRLLIYEKICEGVQCNCELGSALNMAPNLISHHLSILRGANLIHAERAPEDARWVYYAINKDTMQEIRTFLIGFFDPDRIQPRLPVCGPAFENVVNHDRKNL